jgi:hypothetical protein
MKRAFVFGWLVLLQICSGCVNSSQLLPPTAQLTEENSDKNEAGNNNVQLEMRDENTLEVSRLHTRDELGVINETTISFRDEAKAVCFYNMAGKLNSARETRSDGRVINYIFKNESNTTILVEEFYRLDGTLEAVRQSDPGDNRSEVSTSVAGKLTKITRNPKTYKTTYFAVNGKDVICVQEVKCDANQSLVSETYYVSASKKILGKITLVDGNEGTAKTNVFNADGKPIMSIVVEGHMSELGYCYVLTHFRPSDGSIHFKQRWAGSLVVGAGMLERVEEFAADGKTIVRKISFGQYIYFSDGQVAHAEATSFDANGKTLSTRKLRENMTVIEEVVLDTSGNIAKINAHTEEEALKEMSEGVLLTAIPQISELAMLEELKEIVASVRYDNDLNHRWQILSK